MATVRIALSHNDTTYTEYFSNGRSLYSILEKGSASITVGFLYDSIRVQTCKLTISSDVGYVEEFCSYQYVKVYKDNVLQFTGKLKSKNIKVDTATFRSVSLTYDDFASDWKDKQFMPVVSDSDPHRVVSYNGGNIEEDIAYTQAQIAYLEAVIPALKPVSKIYGVDFEPQLTKMLAEKRKELSDLQERKDGIVTWVLEYFESDGIKLCDPSDTSHSLLHILLGYLSDLTLDCTYTDKTPVPYFRNTGTDKVLDAVTDLLSQNGLAMYVSNKTLHIVDLLTATGSATTITNIEEGASIDDKPYIDKRTPDVRYLQSAVEYTNVEVYKLSETDTKVKVKSGKCYPEDAPVLKTQVNGETIEVTKTTVNHSPLTFPHTDYQEIVKITNTSYKCTGRAEAFLSGKTVEVIKATQDGLYFDWKLYNPSIWDLSFKNFIVTGDVLMTNYNGIVKSPTPNGETLQCRFIYNEIEAIRCLTAMAYAKESEAHSYSFYTTQDLPIGAFVTINNVTTDTALRIISKTDALDGMGGFTYKAVKAYKDAEIAFDTSYVPSDNTIPSPDYDFSLTASRTTISCLANRTPRDTTAVRVTIKPYASHETPTVTVAGVAVTPIQDTITTIEEGTTFVEAINSWHIDIDPNLNGYDSCIIEATIGDTTHKLTLSKLVEAELLSPDIIVPSGYTLVKQYCYGNAEGPDPRWVKDKDYDLQDADDIVADIWWQDEVNGQCPLRPRSGYYIWMRQGVYDPDEETEPSTWAISLYDTPYLRFDFDVTPNTFVRNLRLKGQNDKTTISLTPNIVGYDTSLVVPYSSYGTFSFDQTLQQYILDIPYDNTEDLIRVGLVIGDIPNGNILVEKYVMLTVDDQTERKQYFGVYPVTEGASTYNTPSDNPSNVCIVGDTFLKNDGTPMTLVSISSGTYSWSTASSKEAWATMLDDALSNPAVTLSNDNPYVTWIANLAVKDAFIRSLLTQKLQLQAGGYIWGGDVQLGQDGAPAKVNGRYVIGDNGGFVIDSTGYMQAKEAVLESVTVKNSVVDGDSTINGTIMNTVPNENDPSIIETVFRTNKERQASTSIKALKVDGTNTPDAYKAQDWYDHIYDWINSNSFASDQSYECTDSDFLGKTILGIHKSSGAGSVLVQEHYTSNAHTAGEWTMFSNTYLKSVKVHLYIYACHTEGIFGIDRYYSAYVARVYDKNGNLVDTPVNVASAKSDNVTNDATVTVPAGGWVNVRINGGGGQTAVEERGHTKSYYSESENWYDGISLVTTETSASKISNSRVFPRGGFNTSATRIECSVGTKQLVFQANASWAVPKYYRFAYTSGYAPSNTELITTSLLQNKKYEYPDGTAKVFSYIQYKNTQLTIVTNDGTSQTFYTAGGNYYRSHDIDISTITSILGAFSQNVMPIYDENGNRVGTGYVGSQQRPWYQGFAEAGWQQGSLRARKENIERYLGKALELFNSVTVCSFRYKCDHDNPDAYTHYGFIADDTDERLSSPSHDIMEIGNCIGLLIKAVQELSQEIDNLKEK